MEMLSKANISYKYENAVITVHDHINAKETKVFKISKMPFLSIEITKPKEGWLYVFNKPIMQVGKTIVIGRITVEVDTYSSKGIDRVEFYIDNELKFIDDDEPYQWLWNEKAFGIHKIKVVAYSGKNFSIDEIEVLIFDV